MGTLDSLYSYYGNALQGVSNNYSSIEWTTAASTTNTWYDYTTDALVTGKKDPFRAKPLSALPPNQAWLDERVNEMRVAL